MWTKWHIAGTAAVVACAVLLVSSSSAPHRLSGWGTTQYCDDNDLRPRTPTKEQRKAARRASRRAKKDEQLAAKKLARAETRAKTQLAMTEEQKREQIERTKMQRVEQYQKLDDGKVNGVHVVVDLGFAADQSQRECHSVLKQLGCVYGYMKQCPLDRLLSLHIASCDGDIAALCEQRGVHNWKITRHAVPVQELFPEQVVVYLSPDATDVLERVDPAHVYVVGGIVDRSVRKGESLSKAYALAVRTARLPLQEHMSVRTHVLNIDSVVIALNEAANHGDWQRAFAVAVPKRIASSRKEKRRQEEAASAAMAKALDPIFIKR